MMESIPFVREADRPSTGAPSARGVIDVTPMLGTWVNTNPDSDGIATLAIARDGDRVAVRATRATPPINWGEARAETIFAGGLDSRTIVGAITRHDFGFMESLLELNLNQGLLIAAGFSTFKDKSGRSNYFFREFYYRLGPTETAPAAPQHDPTAPGAAPGAAGGPLDPASLLGEWFNTDADARGIRRIVITPADGRVSLRVFGAGSPAESDWGEQGAAVFAKDASSREGMAFDALYDFGFMRVRLQANVKLGVLVVASFNEFNDESGRSSYFTREFFHRRARPRDQ